MMPTETFDPTKLTADQARTLDEPELAVAVTLRILGDDLTANTEERIKEAVSEWTLGNPDWRLVFQQVTLREFQWEMRLLSRGITLETIILESPDVWRHRHGQPWQADLEAHVAAWRAEPPKLTNDLAVSMFDEGMPLGDVRFTPRRCGDTGLWFVDNSWTGESLAWNCQKQEDAVFIASLVRAVSGEWKRPERPTIDNTPGEWVKNDYP